MRPILFEIFGFPIHSYGLLIAVGFLLCVFQSKKEGERLGLPAEKLVDLGFWSLLVGMIGARILFVITLLPEFLADPIRIPMVWEGGLVFYAGPIACIPFYLWYCKRYKMDPWVVLDIAAQAVPLAHAFGRLGCFAAGCCYGKPTESFLGIAFNSPLIDKHLQGIHLHPTQLYEALSLFAIWFYLRRLRFRKKFDGQLVFTYAILYAIVRSIVEIFRGDMIRGFVIGDWLSTSQFISIFVIVAALLLYKWRSKTKRTAA